MKNPALGTSLLFQKRKHRNKEIQKESKETNKKYFTTAPTDVTHDYYKLPLSK